MRRHATIPTALGDEIRTSFDVNAENYLEDDIHWGDDSDLIYSAGKGLCDALHRPIDVLYLGVGPGHILSQLVTRRTFFRRIRAIDYSQNMIDLARSRLVKLKPLHPGVLRRVSLVCADFLADAEYRESDDMVLMLNNTLGNVVFDGDGAVGRARALAVCARALRPGGLLFLTAYNFRRIRFEGEMYTPQLRVSERLDAQDFLLTFEAGTVHHMMYSHWFTVRELTALLRAGGLTPMWVKRRRERIIVVAKKT